MVQPVCSGVPQGSVIGPLLFSIHVNDMSKFNMFADDTKIFTEVKDFVDSERLQDDLKSLVKWAKDWLLRLNVNACQLELD